MFLLFLLSSATTESVFHDTSSSSCESVSLREKIELQEAWKTTPFYFDDGEWIMPDENYKLIDSENTLNGVLESINKDYMKSMEDPNYGSKPKKSSHLVCKKDGHYFKFLNLTKSDGSSSDEAPANEFIGRSLYEICKIPYLNAPVGLFDLKIIKDEIVQVQVSQDLGNTTLSKASDKGIPVTPESLSWQFILSLILGYGDAKDENYRVVERGSQKDLVSFDLEMILNKPVIYRKGRGGCPGVINTLFCKEKFMDHEVNETVVDFFKEKKEKTDLSAALKDMFSIISSEGRIEGESFPAQFYNKMIDQDHIKNSYSKEQLFMLTLQVYHYWKLIEEQIAESKPTPTHRNLLEIYSKDLERYYERVKNEDEHHITHEGRDEKLEPVTDVKFYEDIFYKMSKRMGEKDCEWLQKVQQERNKREVSAVAQLMLAQYFYGKYCEGKAFDNNYCRNKAMSYLKQAKTWIELASDFIGDPKPGNIEALNIYGVIYNGQRPNQKKFQQMIEIANKGNVDMQSQVAEMFYADGKYEEAVHYWQKASKKLRTKSLCNLGMCYYEGQVAEKNGIPNIIMAAYYFQTAAAKGSKEAQYNLGVCDARINNELNTIEQNAKLGCAKAQFALGFCYREGVGVTQNYQTAFGWYQKAAERKHANAQYELGKCYYEGKVVKQDYEKALAWYEKAADQGLAAAQYNLGCCHERGEVVKQDHDEAFKWYKKAAEHGHAETQHNLGDWCFALGLDYKEKGDLQSILKSYSWFYEAKMQGHPKAATEIDSLLASKAKRGTHNA